MNIYNAALVTPTYYVFFTSATIVTSAVLFKGFKGSAISITTVVMGFLQICSGVVLLQLSKSAKDVPDTAVFKGDLDQLREVAEQKEPESEPKADAIRGAAAIVRRFSTVRRQSELDEAKEYRRQRFIESTEAPVEGETYEWDGLRRRKTVLGPNRQPSTYQALRTDSSRRPPLGMSSIPEDNPDEQEMAKKEGSVAARSDTILSDLTRRVSKAIRSGWKPVQSQENDEDPFISDAEKDNPFSDDTPYVGAKVVAPESAHIDGDHAERHISYLTPNPFESSSSNAKSLKHQFSFEYDQSEANVGLAPLHRPTAVERKARNYASDEETRGLVQSEQEEISSRDRDGRPALPRNASSSSGSSIGLRQARDPFDESPTL